MKTPVRAPQANAIAERFVRTVRSECLDWLLIFNRRHLQHVLHIYVGHYNRQRPTSRARPATTRPHEATRAIDRRRDPPPRPTRRPHPRVPPSRRLTCDTDIGALQACGNVADRANRMRLFSSFRTTPEKLIAPQHAPHPRRTCDHAQVDLSKKAPLCGAFAEPSDGLEPSTPSLPWRCSTN